MVLSGSAHLLQDTTPVLLVAAVVGSTPKDAPGEIMLSFGQEPGVFSIERNDGRCLLTMKWELTFKLQAAVHILVLQNRLLRGEPPELPGNVYGVFTFAGGARATPIECSWDVNAAGVIYRPAADAADVFEFILSEAAAIGLATGLAEQHAKNGVARQLAAMTSKT